MFEIQISLRLLTSIPILTMSAFATMNHFVSMTSPLLEMKKLAWQPCQLWLTYRKQWRSHIQVREFVGTYTLLVVVECIYMYIVFVVLCVTWKVSHQRVCKSKPFPPTSHPPPHPQEYCKSCMTTITTDGILRSLHLSGWWFCWSYKEQYYDNWTWLVCDVVGWHLAGLYLLYIQT